MSKVLSKTEAALLTQVVADWVGALDASAVKHHSTGYKLDRDKDGAIELTVRLCINLSIAQQLIALSESVESIEWKDGAVIITESE